MIEKIKRLMEFNGMNQKKLSQLTGLSPVLISRYLSSKRKPTIELAVKTSKVFDVSLDWLLKDEYK